MEWIAVSILVIVAQLPSALSFPSTAPALLWSSHPGSPNDRVKEAVIYQTLSPKLLAKSVMSEGGWSNLLCSGKELQQPVDLALLFVGRELQSSDVSGHQRTDPSLVDLLKGPFTKSKFSLAYPYVAASEETVAMESSLVSEFAETCGHGEGVTNIAVLGSCSVEGENVEKLADIQSVHNYLVSRREKRSKGQANLIVFCHGGSSSLSERSESQVFSELISSVEQSVSKYEVLYVSDLFRSNLYPSSQELHRFLAEGSFGNGSVNSTACDGVCQIKSSLLEGLFVGLVLLVILISGLCCMMGIDTPTRFETPQDS